MMTLIELNIHFNTYSLEIRNNNIRQSLPPNRLRGNFLQPIIERLKKQSSYNFSHMIYLMSRVICLNNSHR